MLTLIAGRRCRPAVATEKEKEGETDEPGGSRKTKWIGVRCSARERECARAKGRVSERTGEAEQEEEMKEKGGVWMRDRKRIMVG